MKKTLMAQAVVTSLIVSSIAVADGPPPGAQLRAQLDNEPGLAVSYVGFDPPTSNTRWAPGRATLATGMGKDMYDWINASFDNGSTTDGAHVLGFANVDPKTAKILSGITIKEPLITEVVFPPLDRSITQQPGSIDVSMIADFSNVSATAPTIKLPTQALPAWMTSDFTITIGNGTPSPNATSPITIDVPRDSKSGAPIAKPTFGKPIHLYFPASALSAIDAWKKSKKGSNVKITYLSTTKSPLFDLVLQSCVPTTETFSGIVDTVVACTSASFDVRFF